MNPFREPRYTKSEDEMIEIAVARAADQLKRIYRVVELGVGSHALREASGSAGLLAVTHAIFNEELGRVHVEHAILEELEPCVGGVAIGGVAMRPRSRGRARPAGLRSVPVEPLEVEELEPDPAIAAALEPRCDCDPLRRREDPAAAAARGSWHLDTCPESPRYAPSTTPPSEE